MKLTRNIHAEIGTLGNLKSDFLEDQILSTIERPWVAHTQRPGGANDVSCVPDGIYKLVPFKRPRNGMIVPQLFNPELGVYLFEDDLPPEGGRFLVLMHPGNFVKNVIGCIASGMSSSLEPFRTYESRDAQILLMQAFNAGDTELIIESFHTKEIYVPGAD